MSEQFPYLKQMSKMTGVPPENLVKAYKIEKSFHERIISEKSRHARRDMYKEVYEAVHPLYLKSSFTASASKTNPKTNLARLFSKELCGKSVLDVGCGQGYFLKAVSDKLPHGRLMGIDISAEVLPKNAQGIEFARKDVIDFEVDEKFDVVFSDNVLEHIAPADIPVHLRSVKKALKKNGTYIAILPNRLFGPCDITRIVDFTYTNRVSATGTHLHESTYTELTGVLGKNGFTNFRTVLPAGKFKYLFPFLRIGTGPLAKIEGSRALLRLFYRFGALRALAGYFTVMVICENR